MSDLFSPFECKGLQLKNRIVMPPMCQYSASAQDGMPEDWHDLHYTSRAIGGAGLIIVEMTNVEPDGRITNKCLGLWSDEHVPAFARVVESCHRHGAKMGVQIAHAGRKAEDAAVPVSSTDVPFDSTYNKPRPLTTDEVKQMVEKFRLAARRAVKAGFDTIELHGAHGYLIHQFHSPYINKRTDEYGKDLTKFGVEVIQAVKSEMPSDMPLIMRISAKEYVVGGYDVEDAIEISKRYEQAGVDIFHISSGGEASYKETGMTPRGIPSSQAGYQVPLAKAFKDEFQTPVISVGKLEDPVFADSVIKNGEADLVAIGRGMLSDPYWALHAAAKLEYNLTPPPQYVTAFQFRQSTSK